MTLLGVFLTVCLPCTYLGLLALYVAYTYGAMQAPHAYRAGLRDADRAMQDARARGVWHARLPPGTVIHAFQIGGRQLVYGPLPLEGLGAYADHVRTRFAQPVVVGTDLEVVVEVLYPDPPMWRDAYIRLHRKRVP